jgi:O-antigen/teichoic acid export membrane protein
MSLFRRFRPDILSILLLILLPLLWFGPVLFTGKTLLPYDNLYTFEPWKSLQPGLIPHNNLLSDLVLENAVWKLHVQRALAGGEIPLWNPQVFTGIPFLAGGQSSALYPLSILFYLLPLDAAYGWFTALQLAIAGINLYLLGRVLRLRPLAALYGGVVFQFSGFLIVSVVFSMVLAAAVWLPLLLAIIEYIIRKQEEKGAASFRPIPYVIAGAAVIGLVALAGHPEFFYYTLLVAGMYSGARLGIAWRRISTQRRRDAEAQGEDGGRQTADGAARNSQLAIRNSQFAIRITKLAGWLLVLAVLGIAAGAVQILPLFELVSLNFREGSASYQEVVGWAWPSRHVLTFFLPDVFGNPSHHAWFDLWNGRWVPATVNALGEQTDTIFWGIKNYVEGGNYVGILTWLLAGGAVVVAGGRWQVESGKCKVAGGIDAGETTQPATCHLPLSTPTWIFAGLALLSLLFAFGTPLYALLFYGLPGWNQLHSPFRWVFPFTLSMAILGGIGLEQLMRKDIGSWVLGIGRVRVTAKYLLSNISILFVVAGIALLATVLASYFFPTPFLALAQRIVDGSDLARMAFADGRMFWGYESVGLAKLGTFLALSGLVVWLLARRTDDEQQTTDRATRNSQFAIRLGVLAVAIVFFDLFAAHGTFNPATDPALSPLKNVPPVVEFINQREGLTTDANTQYPIPNPQSPTWRFTTFDLPGAKTFNANVGMYYGWQDIRGYDSIIPKQYVDLMNRVADQSGELLYNRIAPLYETGISPYGINNPLIDLLGVKYLLTEQAIPAVDGWTQVYPLPASPTVGEEPSLVRVYENSEAFPRAFIAQQALVTPADSQPILEMDLRRFVFIEETPADPAALIPASPQIAEANISRYTANTVFVDVNLSDRGWLVLADAWFPGWKAYLRPFGGDENQETELPIFRANGALRAVYLPDDGQWTVRFTYSPMSFKLGLYISFLAGMTGLLLLLWWLWGRYYRPADEGDEASTVAKNSLVPMGLSLTNKVIDFAFAMLYVRLLGPEGTGKYAFVVAVYGFFEILSRYGLGTLLTRDVAADRAQASRYLTNVLGLRTILWLVSMPVLALVAGGYWYTGSIGVQEVQAIAIFGVAMLFANWADAFSNLFYAYEKMEYPAGLGSATALLKVALGALVLLLGWGFVGLAVVSLAMNVLQMLWLALLVRRTLFRPVWHWDWPLQRWMFGESGPLMINHLLATIFWRIDLWILRPMAGAFSVGIYSASLKYLDGLNIIPSTFTFAIFPLMSRYAKREGEGLLRSYALSVRLLLLVSLPLALSITALAEPLIYILGGAEFLNVPDTVILLGREISYRGGSALALQVIIWSIPIGFVNSVTQYVLIAVNQQRYLTSAFILGVVFNVVGNLLVIPRFDYIGAAVVTILSEFSLLIPFYWRVRRHVGRVDWGDLLWRPVIALVGMGGTIYGLASAGLSVWLGVGLGWIVYGLLFWLLGGFRGEDMAVVGRALPLGRWRKAP